MPQDVDHSGIIATSATTAIVECCGTFCDCNCKVKEFKSNLAFIAPCDVVAGHPRRVFIIYIWLNQLSNMPKDIVDTYVINIYLPQISCVRQLIKPNIHHLDSSIKIDQLDITCFIISLFTAQHVSNVITSIFRSLRLIVDYFMCCIALVRCVLVLRRGSAGVVWYRYAG